MFTITTTPEPAIDGVIIELTGSLMADAGQQLQMKLTFALAGHPQGVAAELRRQARKLSLDAMPQQRDLLRSGSCGQAHRRLSVEAQLAHHATV